MFYKRIIFTVLINFLFSVVSIAQAAPPPQGGDLSGDSTLGETLDLDDVDDTIEGKHNLGTIMSGRKDVPGDTPTPTPTPQGVPAPGSSPDDPVGDHPVASALANYFDVSYDDIMDLHLAGNGFGTITKAYFFADKLDMDPDDLLDLARGSGWGNVLKDKGIHPGSVGNGGGNRPDHAGPPDQNGSGNSGPPGQIKKNADPSDMVGQSGGNGNGNKGGNGQGNGGGNGNKGGNGGGNGNGHGNGNSGGNGNGGGKGRGGK